ncbi:hypothetical protein [Sphaerisporangium sp. TRM90804]|uniref:hypothetical protein n=1 Tax=Sphaerisporangium sp. TRM90804 TaxID=3031113 RepID=UPI0024468B25|nr:hypothetical protein [Sphaerisporangium sp. TRM90804]MDH2425732.1 hypothetical protein [Sphaerisporangium sp. TRM90804]
MNGPDHFQEAERCAAEADEAAEYAQREGQGRENPEDQANRAAAWRAAEHARGMGLLHAMLAQAAATAMQPSQYSTGRPEIARWYEVAGVKPDAG